MDPDNQLHNLLDKYLQNTCTEEEMQELFDVLKRAENEPEIKRFLSDYWQQLSESDISAQLTLPQEKEDWFDEIFSVALMRENPSSDGHQPKPKKRKTGFSSYNHKSTHWLPVVAMLLFSVILSLVYFTIIQGEPDDSIIYKQKTPGPGEKVRFMLSDGTQVHLNSESRLKYPASFTGSNREVYLDGEAYFVVARDETRPFLIHTDKITTRVLGTSFSIRAYPDENQAIVAVTSGKVSVAESGTDNQENDSNVLLEANQWINYTAEKRSFSTGNDVTPFTAWNNGVLLYHDKKFGEVAYQLERWYGVDINFENEAIKDCVIRGEHMDETLENVLKAITFAFNVEYKIENRQVTLTGRGCD